jgi:hypothetical protein
LVSIQRPLGYEPNTLPLRQSAASTRYPLTRHSPPSTQRRSFHRIQTITRYAINLFTCTTTYTRRKRDGSTHHEPILSNWFDCLGARASAAVGSRCWTFYALLRLHFAREFSWQFCEINHHIFLLADVQLQLPVNRVLHLSVHSPMHSYSIATTCIKLITRLLYSPVLL